MAQGAFHLEGLTAFVEPGLPLPALVVSELGLFVSPDERGTGLRGGGEFREIKKGPL